MTIGTTSRYQEGEALWIRTRKRGNKQTVYLNTVVTVMTPYSLALMREGDSEALLAYGAYNDPKRWWVIADANPHWFYPLDTYPGESLRVPS